MKSALELTYDLVRIRSTADRPEELVRIVEYAEAFFADTTFVRRRYEKNGKPSLVVSTTDTLSPDILLLGHLDVVPADEPMFEPREADGKLYGRGVCDMKSECAVLMRLMHELGSQPNPPNIALMLTTDEELGGANGAGYLVNEIGYRCRVGIVPDTGNCLEGLVLTNKGILHLRLTAQGKNAHGSRPWLGENAIEKLISSFQKIRAIFPDRPVAERWENTINIGMIAGGRATNQVPDQATAQLDVRFTETEDAAALLASIRNAADGCEVEVMADGIASLTSPDHPAVQLYGELLQSERGAEVKHDRSCGAHDGRFLTAYGIPVIVSRPDSGDQHSPNEWLSISSLEPYEQFYRVYLARLASTFG